MKHMLVGVDGSPSSLRALTWTADLCDRAGLGLVAARVFNPTEAELSPARNVALHLQERGELEEWCRGLPQDLPLELELLDGDPRDALLAEADDLSADLVVVGHEGAGRPHPDFGSVAKYLTQHTSRPLAIAPRGPGQSLDHLVVAVDGSPGSLNGVSLAADLASRLGIGVTAVFAIDPLVDVVPPSDPDSWQRQAVTAVRRWTAPIADAGVPVDVDIDRDVRPVAAIVRALEARPGSAACLGLRGLSDFSGLRIGHVALHLLRKTDAALILVPRASTT